MKHVGREIMLDRVGRSGGGALAGPIIPTWAWNNDCEDNGDGAVTKTGLVSGWNANSASAETMDTSRDGGIMFVNTSASSCTCMIGLISTAVAVPLVSAGHHPPSEIKFYRLSIGTTVSVYLTTSNVFSLENENPADELEIRVRGGVYEAVQNGEVVYTAGTTPAASVRAFCAMNTAGATSPIILLTGGYWSA